MEIGSIAFRIALSVTFVTFIGVMLDLMMTDEVSKIFGIILSCLFGLTILSWVVFGLMMIWS